MPKNKSKKEIRQKKQLLSPNSRYILLSSHKSNPNVNSHSRSQAEEKQQNITAKKRKITLPIQELIKEKTRRKSQGKVSKSLKNISNSRTTNRINSSSINHIKSLQTLQSTTPTQELSTRFGQQQQKNSRGREGELLERLTTVLDQYQSQLGKERKEKESLRKQNLKLRQKLKLELEVLGTNEYQM